MHIAPAATIALIAAWSTLLGSSPSAQEPTARVPLDGRSVYLAYCASCHGVEGKGDGPAAEAMKRKPVDLTTIAKNNKGMFPRRTIEDVIVNGGRWKAHGSKEMPTWGPVFRLADPSENIPTARLQNLLFYLEGIQTQ